MPPASNLVALERPQKQQATEKKQNEPTQKAEAEEKPDMVDELFGDAQPGEGVGEVEGFDENAENAEEDSGPKLVSPDPGQPTQSEIGDHNVDHWPYRCWCGACVKGRGVGEAHRGEGRRAGCSAVPVIAFDYLFSHSNKLLS